MRTQRIFAKIAAAALAGLLAVGAGYDAARAAPMSGAGCKLARCAKTRKHTIVRMRIPSTGIAWPARAI